ncbi:FUSC family protein [Xanthobacter sp. V4C-4]|uniref:FUSC family protein n=1 Tax=Xanthobacter cornucopiae TaxID=3119924 RepID=UPI003726BFD1
MPSFPPKALGQVFTAAHVKLGVKAALAALAAYGLAYGLDLPNGYWAVLTAILVVQSTIGASLSVAIDRALGTVVGGGVGVVAAMAAGPSVTLTFVALGVAVIATSTLAARFSSYKLAPVTAVIVLLSDPTHMDPWISGLHRVFEIGLGGAVGVLCALLVLPARAVYVLFPHCATAVKLCGALLALGSDGLLGRGLDPAEMDALNAKTRQALRAADARIAEARAERRLSGHADPTPVVRACRRLWHSVIILLRGTDTTLSAQMAALLGAGLDAAVSGLSLYMQEIARRLDGDKGVDLGAPGEAARAAVVALDGEVERLNAAGAFDGATGADLRTLFAAISACGHVMENLDELVARLAEMDGGAD